MGKMDAGDLSRSVIVAGGGAAGFFGAIAAKTHYPDAQVLLLEKSRQLLAKVRISGGGRCNVTHHCFDPLQLVKNYPRGHKELIGPFHRFQPRDTMAWFESRGVKLKTEEDGRVFPLSDSSETIIQCLFQEAQRVGVDILIEQSIEDIDRLENQRFSVRVEGKGTLVADRILIATGSSSRIFALLQKKGHTIVPPVPSLFTFNIPTSPFLPLSGVVHPKASIGFPCWGISTEGPLLFTHWGLSGPAVLKLSAFASRKLHEAGYQQEVEVNWTPHLSKGELQEHLMKKRQTLLAKQIGSESDFSMPKQLWRKLLILASVKETQTWSSLSNKQLQALISLFSGTRLEICGKTTYKQEFVTCGGVALEEVNFKTMESRILPGLFFAGEVLDIDGITGGFNFQNAWTTSWIAGSSLLSQV